MGSRLFIYHWYELINFFSDLYDQTHKVELTILLFEGTFYFFSSPSLVLPVVQQKFFVEQTDKMLVPNVPCYRIP